MGKMMENDVSLVSPPGLREVRPWSGGRIEGEEEQPGSGPAEFQPLLQ